MWRLTQRGHPPLPFGLLAEAIRCHVPTRGADMRRRDLIAGIVGTAAYPFVARAQGQTKPVVGFLDARLADAIPERLRAFRQGLKDTGYIDGENVELIYRFAENQVDRLSALAGDL